MSLLDWLVEHFAGENEGAQDKELSQAIARIVGGTDPRLKALGDHVSKLRPAAARALDFSRDMAASLPQALEANPSCWASNPYLRALFFKPEALGQWLAHHEELKPWLRGETGSACCYALMVAGIEEKSFFGSCLSGDLLRQDVLQHSISFVRHRLLAVAPDLATHRAQILWQIFDQLVLGALHALAHARSEKDELAREAGLLHSRLLMLRRRQQHLDGALALDPLGSVAQLEAQLKSNTEALQRAREKPCTLDECLDVVVDAMSSPQNVIRCQDEVWRVNAMNLVVGSDDPEAHDLRFRVFYLDLPEAKHGIALPIIIQREWLQAYL